MSETYILIDFQTTGTVAATSSIIEAGWAIFADDKGDRIDAASVSLVRPEQKLTTAIQKLTGIRDEDYARAEGILEFADMQDKLATFLRDRPEAKILVHYAHFKVPFLKKALAGCNDLLENLDARIICTHRLSKAILPQLKSHSLRAVAGYAGYSAEEKKRALDHLQATAHVWQFLQKSLAEADASRMIENPDGPGQGPQIAREKRLGLPSRAGIYFFRDGAGRVLYVGKASNLKQRVNSYFRGRKTKGSRLNEMLTRASEIDVIECRSELEALLRESDAIKEHDPPYNRLLRMEDRSLIFFTTELLFGVPEGGRYWGPVSSSWILHFLSGLLRGEYPVAGLPGLTEEKLRGGIDLLFERHENPERNAEAWKELAFDIWEQAKAAGVVEDEGEAEDEVLDDDAPETEPFESSEEVADFLEDCILQLLRSMKRSRWMLRLMYADIEWMESGSILALRGSQYQLIDAGEAEPLAICPSYRDRLLGMDLSVMDRLGIVMSQIRKSLKKGEALRVRLGPKLSLDSSELTRFLG